MKLGVSYGVFSGLELLKPSLLNIRPFAHYIAVVYSMRSSTGEQAPSYMEPLLKTLKCEGLIDELALFTPALTTRPIEMQDNCRMKREIGRIMCLKAGCTHHLIRDCDEFHDQGQLKSQLHMFEDADIGITPIFEYAKSPTLRISDVSNLYVPCVHRIDKPLQRYNPFGLKVDMGRTVSGVKTFRKFEAAELVLHHMCLVRINQTELERKYQGHGHLHRLGNLSDFLQHASSFNDSLIEVPDHFHIREYWEGEFQQWLNY